MTKILVADDDRLVLYTLASGLRNAGYEVIEAEDAPQALRLCQEIKPDIALLDVRMPGMSGIDLARHLREETDIPFLFLSAYGDDETVKQGIAQGALGYLVKPLDVAQIVPSIEAALARAKEMKQLKATEENLSVALKNGRETSMAIGLIMARSGVGQQEAFEALRTYARNQRRKVSEVAAEIIKSGNLPDLSIKIQKK